VYVTRVPDDDPRAAAEAAHVNLRAPAFALDTLAASRVATDQLRGSVVLVNFWATWCVPCRSEMPAIQAAYDAHRNDPFSIIAVNAGEDDNTTRQFVDEFHLTFPIALDRDEAILRLYQVQALPTSFFIDPQGIIRATNVGGMSRAYIEAQISALEPSP
jgi:thiol-disulfide isomerase/thioredoxin